VGRYSQEETELLSEKHVLQSGTGQYFGFFLPVSASKLHCSTLL